MSIKLNYIEAKSLGDAWFQALCKIMMEGRSYLITKGSYEGISRRTMPTLINIEFPGSRPLYPIMPEGSGVPAPTSEEDINEYVSYIMDLDKKTNEHYTYGEDLSWQIPWVIQHYKESGFGTAHCYMTVGRPETLYFYDRKVDYTENIFVGDLKKEETIRTRHIANSWNKNSEIQTSSQCLRGIDTWIEDGKLNFWVYFRSWDLWGGFPVNLGGIQLMKEYMADQIGVEDGSMIVSCKDLHVYEHTWIVALMRLHKDLEDMKIESK